MSPDEVFDYPAEMADLSSQEVFGKMRPDATTIRGTERGRPLPPKPIIPENILPVSTDTTAVLPDSITIPADSAAILRDNASDITDPILPEQDTEEEDSETRDTTPDDDAAATTRQEEEEEVSHE